MTTYRIVGAFQSHSSLDSTKPFITRDAWGVREGQSFAFHVQSWHKTYGWGNSRVEFYLTPATAGAGGAAVVGLRQRTSSLDSSKPWLVEQSYGKVTEDLFAFYVKAWCKEYGWGHSVIEVFLDRTSQDGALIGFRQVTNNQGSTAEWKELTHFGTMGSSTAFCSVYGLAWSSFYQWGYSRLEFAVGGLSAVPGWPMHAGGTKETHSGQWVQAVATLTNAGRLDGELHVWTTNRTYGFHGACVFILVDKIGQILWRGGLQSLGVDGTWIPGLPSSKTTRWTETAPADAISKAAELKVALIENPKNMFMYDLDQAIKLGKKIAEVAGVVAGIVAIF